jgi:hypothetical protein
MPVRIEEQICLTNWSPLHRTRIDVDATPMSHPRARLERHTICELLEVARMRGGP